MAFPCQMVGWRSQGELLFTTAIKMRFPCQNGGLEKPERTAVDNDYQDPSQLQSGKEPKPDSGEITAL